MNEPVIEKPQIRQAPQGVSLQKALTEAYDKWKSETPDEPLKLFGVFAALAASPMVQPEIEQCVISQAHECSGYVKLANGDNIHFRAIISAVGREKGMTDADGHPIYHLNHGITSTVKFAKKKNGGSDH